MNSQIQTFLMFLCLFMGGFCFSMAILQTAKLNLSDIYGKIKNYLFVITTWLKNNHKALVLYIACLCIIFQFVWKLFVSSSYYHYFY